MSVYQIMAIAVLSVYYIAYFAKLIGQKKRGIQTSQLGIGEKDKKTVFIEILLSKVSIVIVITEIVSVIYDKWFQMPNSVKIAGIILSVLGTGIFIIAMLTMQDSWRAGIPSKDKTKLIISGIYKVSRNPAFLGFDLVYIGIGIAFFNPILAIISVITMVLMHFQILEEEKFLAHAFGEEYKRYKKHVGRYLGCSSAGKGKETE